MKISFLTVVCVVLLIACNDQKKPVTGETPATTPVPSASPDVPVMPELPNTVLYKNWEIGNPAYLKLITDAYQSWDNNEPADDLSKFFTDSAVFDLPNGKRYIPKQNIKEQLRKWRNVYAETQNIPFSVISLKNKDFNQEWVMAMVWNKWKYKDGVKDSMLYFDNWRIQDGRIAHMISMEQKINKQMSKTLNERVPKTEAQ